jgi:hypothetical protein
MEFWGADGAIRALCFQLVTDPEIPVRAEAGSPVTLNCPFDLEYFPHRRLGEHRRWSQNGHNKSRILMS